MCKVNIILPISRGTYISDKTTGGRELLPKLFKSIQFNKEKDRRISI